MKDLDVAERKERRDVVVRHLGDARHAHERPRADERRARRTERGLRRRRTHLLRRVLRSERAQLRHRAVDCVRSRVGGINIGGSRRGRRDTNSASVRIMAMCARSTMRAGRGFPSRIAASSRAVHFPHSWSAKGTASSRSGPRRAIPHRSSASTYIRGVREMRRSSNKVQNSSRDASSDACL